MAKNPTSEAEYQRAIQKIDTVLGTSGLSKDEKISAVRKAKDLLDAQEFQKKMFEQSPALHVASKLLGWDRPSPEEEPSLADQFIASTHIEGAKFHGRTKKLFEEMLMRYRVDMRRAHRFVLDDPFVDMATEMSMASPEKVLARLQYATLPYENTWIEFNLHAKMKAIHRVHGSTFNNADEVSERLGMLLQRIDDTSAVCTLVTDYEGRVMPHMTCYFFSLNERTFVSSNAAYFGCIPMVVGSKTREREDEPTGQVIEIDLKSYQTVANADSMGKASLWGYTSEKGTEFVSTQRTEKMRTPSFLMRHGDAGFSRAFPPYDALINSHEGEEGKKKAAELILAELREFTGTIRWLVTVLAMLNQVPVHADLVTRSHQMRIGHFKKHQFVDYHKVSLRLPKLHPIPYLERHLRGPSERRHRAHEVRAHWRTYLHAEHCSADEHAWTYDYDDGYRLCDKCMAYGRLIHEHVRGNAELGWVRKDYVIKPSTKVTPGA
jgi:hypothetical protein